MIIINFHVFPNQSTQLSPTGCSTCLPEDSVARCRGKGGVVHIHVGAENHTDNRHAAAGPKRSFCVWW